MSKKKICHVICDITSGGVESVILNYFSHMNCENYELDLITYDIKSEVCAKKFRDLDFNIIVVPPKRDGFFKSCKAMYKIIKNNDYDIVHTHLTEWNCIPIIIAYLCGIKIRISHSHMAAFPKDVKEKVLFFIQKHLNLMFSTKYCACGDEAAIYLYGNRIYQKGQVKILNNAIDEKKFLPNNEIRQKMRNELGISEDTFCVGHIGRFLEQKNHTFLIDIFYEVVKENPNSCLLLLGIGELMDQIKEKVYTLGLQDKVYFLGILPDPENYYQAMDVFCLPSLFEGLPVVGIEVQAAQLPCVVSDKVSDKVKITDNLEFYSLDNGAKSWAVILLNMKRKNCKFPDEYRIDKMSHEWASLYEV